MKNSRRNVYSQSFLYQLRENGKKDCFPNCNVKANLDKEWFF